MAGEILSFSPREYVVRVTVEILRVFPDAPARRRSRGMVHAQAPTFHEIIAASEKALAIAVKGYSAAREKRQETMRRIQRQRRAVA